MKWKHESGVHLWETVTTFARILCRIKIFTNAQSDGQVRLAKFEVFWVFPCCFTKSCVANNHGDYWVRSKFGCIEPKLGKIAGNWCCGAQTDGSAPVSYYWCQYLQSSAGPLISTDVESERRQDLGGNRNPYFSSDAGTLIITSCIFPDHQTKITCCSKHAKQTFKHVLCWIKKTQMKNSNWGCISFCLAASHLLETQLTTFWLRKMGHIKHIISGLTLSLPSYFWGFPELVEWIKNVLTRQLPFIAAFVPCPNVKVSLEWVPSWLMALHCQFYHTSVTLCQCVTDGARGGGLVASSQWLATH